MEKVVNFYEVTEKQIIVTGDLYRYVTYPNPPSPIYNFPFWEPMDEYHFEECDIHKFVGGQNKEFYLSLSPETRDLLLNFRDKGEEERLSTEIENLSKDYSRFKDKMLNAKFLTRLKWLFTGIKNK